MQNSSIYLSKTDFHKELQEINSKLLEQILGGTLSMNDDFYAVPNKSLHFLSKIVQPNAIRHSSINIEKTYFKILSKTILQAESLSGGASIFGFLFGSFFLKELLKQTTLPPNVTHTDLKANLDRCLLDLKTKLERKIVPFNNSLMTDYVENTLPDNSVLANVVLSAVNLAGLEGKIYIEDGKQSMYSIEKKIGYEFFAKPLKIFLNSAGFLEYQEAKILLVDGLIESVSEIDNLLSVSFENKRPMLLVARGFSEEVIGTLKVNFDKGFLNIIPVLIDSDLESINLLADISAVCGGNVVSSLKGDMLCLVKYDDLVCVDKVRCQAGKIILENQATQGQIGKHLEFLLNKRQENQNVADIVDLVDKRIKALSANTVVIRLPNPGQIESQTIRAKIDILLRDIKSLTSNGIVYFDDLCRADNFYDNTQPSDLEARFIKSLLNASNILKEKNMISPLSVYIGIYLFSKMTLDIVQSDGIVLGI